MTARTGLCRFVFALAAVVLIGPLQAKPLLPDPFPSTYKPQPAQDTLIVNATILDGTGRRMDKGALLLKGGKVAAIGQTLDAPGAAIVDAGGRWVTPGIVDPHSHLGSAVFPLVPVELKTWDVNEYGDPVSPQMLVETTIRTQDPGFAAALAGGVTTLQVLPGSTNLFGGVSVILKNVPSPTHQGMKFPGAPRGLKMACGENPKYNYGGQGRAPASRMGIAAGYRQALEGAKNYKPGGARDFKMEALAAALKGEVIVHVHCYRAEDMAVVMDVAKEYGLKIKAFHHASEAYKIADLLVANGICGVVWPDWWGFKMENYDAIRENAAFLHAAGGCVSLHSDSSVFGQRMSQEAAKAMAAGWRAGLSIPREQAIRWITSTPARILGLDARIGSLEPGKNADVVVWSGDPFNVYTKADLVFIDGARVYDRKAPQPASDFAVGQPAAPR